MNLAAGCRVLVLAQVICGMLFAAGSLARAEETPREDEHGYAFHEFAGDLFTPWSDAAPYPPTSYGSDYTFRQVGELPKSLRVWVLAAIPGLTRERLERLGWGENGGPAIAEFLLADPPDFGRCRRRPEALRCIADRVAAGGDADGSLC